ncbi:hypothetical protein C8Q78DRAFT_8329 [Trametes maxima]|nr:hypothetical protein C8Q78DRAFT_8329 [Trametes maxima]
MQATWRAPMNPVGLAPQAQSPDDRLARRLEQPTLQDARYDTQHPMFNSNMAPYPQHQSGVPMIQPRLSQAQYGTMMGQIAIPPGEAPASTIPNPGIHASDARPAFMQVHLAGPATTPFHMQAPHGQYTDRDLPNPTTQLVSRLESLTLSQPDRISGNKQGDDRAQRIKNRIPPWIPINEGGNPPLPPEAPSDLWTSRFRLGNVYICAVTDNRFTPASMSTTMTTTQTPHAAGQSRTTTTLQGAAALLVGRKDDSKGPQNAEGGPPPVRTEAKKGSQPEADKTGQGSRKDDKQPETSHGKPRPCFASWHLTRSAGIYVAPLLTSNTDPKKLRLLTRRVARDQAANYTKSRVVQEAPKPKPDFHHLVQEQRDWWLPVMWIPPTSAAPRGSQSVQPSIRVPEPPAHPNDVIGNNQRPRVEINCLKSAANHPYTISFIWAADPGHYTAEYGLPGGMVDDGQYCHIPDSTRQMLRMWWRDVWYGPYPCEPNLGPWMAEYAYDMGESKTRK